MQLVPKNKRYYEWQQRRERVAKVNEWLKKQRQGNFTYEMAVELYEKIKEVDAWIFNRQVKHWYTPEEYKEMAHIHKYASTFYQHLEVISPIDGLEAAYKQMDALQQKTFEFNKKVFDYYYKTKF